MKTNEKVSNLVWNFNLAIKKSSQSFVNEYFLGVDAFLEGIYKDGWIAGYKKYVSKGLIEVFLKYDSNKTCIITHVMYLCKPSLQTTIQIQQLVAISKNTAYTGVIRTANNSFLTNRVALQKKTGGVYLVKIF